MMYKNNKLFCKIFTAYYGQEINTPDQLERCNMTGTGLRDFCEFYLSHFRTYDEIEAEKEDRKISIILWFVIGMITGMIIIYLAIEFNIKLHS